MTPCAVGKRNNLKGRNGLRLEAFPGRRHFSAGYVR